MKLTRILVFLGTIFIAYSQTSTHYFQSRGSSLAANYFNENTTSLRLYFTASQALTNPQVFGKITSANLSSCDENTFDVNSPLELGTGNGGNLAGNIWGTSISNGVSAYIDLYPSEIYSALGANSDWSNKEGDRLYFGIRFNSSNSKWDC